MRNSLVWACVHSRCFELKRLYGWSYVYTHLMFWTWEAQWIEFYVHLCSSYTICFEVQITLIWTGNDSKAKYGLIDTSEMIVQHCLDMPLSSRHGSSWWWLKLVWGWEVASSKYCSQWGFLEIFEFRTIDP